MNIVGAVFGLLVLVAVLVLWFRAYRDIKGSDGPLLSPAGRKQRKQNDSLEEFIAAYRRGEVAAGTSAATAPTATQAPASTGGAPVAQSTTRAPGEAFLSGPAKLAYLACKTGLRDHHIFARVQLSALDGGATLDAFLARSSIDLLICSPSLSPVAAADFADSTERPAHAQKLAFLKGLGIRYLQLSDKSLPRPDEWHALLYKM